MTRGLIFVLSLAAIDAHSQTPDVHPRLTSCARVIHLQSDSISELSGKVASLQKSVAASIQVEKKTLENSDKMIHALQQEIDVLAVRLQKSDK
jgi:hypothetical protein